jgi:hypothetical protein
MNIEQPPSNIEHRNSDQIIPGAPMQNVTITATQWGCIALALFPFLAPLLLLVLFRLIECAALSWHAMISAF